MNDSKAIVLPDYLKGQEDHTIHLWLRWNAMAKKIDTHENRFYTMLNQKTGETRILDLKASKGVALKSARLFGVSESQLKEISKYATELQTLKAEKGKLNKNWTREVYGGKKRGDQTILDLKYVEILELFGSYHNQGEVYNIITNKWGFSINQDKLKEFQQKNKDKIANKRADYVNKHKEFRLTTDTGRLEVLSKLAYEMENKFESAKSIAVSRELRAIIEQIRKEIKGEEIRLTVDGRIDIHATIQASQTLEQVLSKLPINLMVVGLTSAKNNINPQRLMYSLTNSYYSKWNGFNKLASGKSIELPGKYIKNYDWNMIEEVNTTEEAEFEMVEETVVHEDEVDRIEHVQRKGYLMELLEAYKKEVKK
jgi:hypothetical protein